MVCFIACHISDPERVGAFATMLGSIAQQWPRRPLPVAVSWSSTAEVADAVREALAAAAAAGLDLRPHEQPAPRSQFEHLRALTALHAAAPPAWVIFSDDDDLWSERRQAIYRQQCDAAPDAAPAVLCRRKCNPLGMGRSYVPPTTPDEVRAMLRAGKARLTDANERDGLAEEEHNLAEYFEYAVRYRHLAAFFAKVPRCVTTHKLCDLGFAFSVDRDKATVRFMPAEPDEFVYFYSRGDRAGGASGVQVEKADVELAREGLIGTPCVRATFADPAFGLSGGEELGGAANFVAEVRQAVKQELIRMRVTGPVLPRQLVLAACAHEAAVTIQAYNLGGRKHHSAAGSVPGFREWAVALASTTMLDCALNAFEFEAIVDWDTWQVTRYRTTRTDAEILAHECGYADDAAAGGQPGFVLKSISSFPLAAGARPRVGAWPGGSPPPPGIKIGLG